MCSSTDHAVHKYLARCYAVMWRAPYHCSLTSLRHDFDVRSTGDPCGRGHSLYIVLLAVCLSSTGSSSRGVNALARSWLSVGLVGFIVVTLVIELVLSWTKFLLPQQPDREIATGLTAFAWIVLGAQKQCPLLAILGLCAISILHNVTKVSLCSLVGDTAVDTPVCELLIVSSRLFFPICVLGRAWRAILCNAESSSQPATRLSHQRGR